MVWLQSIGVVLIFWSLLWMLWDKFAFSETMILLAFGLMLLLTGVAFGHDHSRPELNKWFDSLQNQKGGLCCSHDDGTIVTDSDWEVKDGHYRVFLEREWRDVPDEAILKEPNLDGRTIVWPVRYWSGDKLLIVIRCFIPGSMT